MQLFLIPLFIILSFQIPEGEFDQDSLNNEINKYPVQERIDIYLDLSKRYTNESFEKAFYYAQKAIELAQHTGNFEKEVDALHLIAIAHYVKTQYDKSLSYFTKALKLSEKNNYEFGMAKSYNGLGVIYKNIAELNTSLDYYQKALDIFLTLQDKQAISVALSNIGVIYKRWKEYDKALEYLNKSIKYAEEIDDKGCLSRATTNLGLVYIEMEEYEEALKCFKWSLNTEILENNELGIATAYQNIGDVYAAWKQYNRAIEYYLNAFDIEKQIGNTHGIIIALNSIGNAYIDAGQPQKSIPYFNQAIKMSKEAGLIKEIQDSYEALSIAYEKTGDISSSYEYYKLYISFKDSLSNLSRQEEFAKLEIKYKTKQTEKELQLKELENQKMNTELNRQRTLLVSFLSGFVFVCLILILLIRMYRMKNKANRLLMEQKEEIISQRDEISRQKDIVSARNKEIKDSIEYAVRIQYAIFPNPEILRSYVSEYFIFYQPRDVLSGDFYWFNKIDDLLIIAVADCTGHGVPGALMSILGAAFLNEIINKEKIISPSEILNRLRLEVITVLKQSVNREDMITVSQTKDGMDIALCTINLNSLETKYAGANNSIYIVTNNSKTKENLSGYNYQPAGLNHEISNNYDLYEIKADKMPIATYVTMDDFSEHTFQLNKDDAIYMFSDGFADQFGGESGKKFKYKPFKQLILNIAALNMKEQKIKMISSFTEWKNEYRQVDDVLVTGIRL
ncbi:MAG: hypothetical protein Kow0068_04470 [Marinilabiliales bacterium]